MRRGEALSDGGQRAFSARDLGYRTIIAAEVALALMPLAGASLLSQTMLNLGSRPLGFDPRHVVTVSTTFTGQDAFARISPEHRQLVADVVDRLGALPGVESAAAATSLLFLGQAVVIAGGGEFRAHQQVVTERYFETVGAPVLSGRGFVASDLGSPPRAVVSREFERRYLDGAAASRSVGLPDGRTFEVIGVVADVRTRHPADELLPTVYVLDGPAGGEAQFAVRTTADPQAIVPLIRGAIAGVSPQLVVTATGTLEETVFRALAAERFRTLLGLVFAGAATLLAGVGIFGLAARQVAVRSRELGLRMALGATPRAVRTLLVGETAATAGVGAVIGLPLALAGVTLVRAFLPGVDPVGAPIFVVSAGVLFAAAACALVLPARRAGRTDPMVVMRS